MFARTEELRILPVIPRMVQFLQLIGEKMILLATLMPPEWKSWQKCHLDNQVFQTFKKILKNFLFRNLKDL